LIIQKVQEELRGDSQIDGVIFIWNPTACGNKLREDLLQQLRKGLGEEVFKSMIFLINKRTAKWEDDEEGVAAKSAIDKVTNFTGMRVPNFICDIKLEKEKVAPRLL